MIQQCQAGAQEPHSPFLPAQLLFDFHFSSGEHPPTSPNLQFMAKICRSQAVTKQRFGVSRAITESLKLEKNSKIIEFIWAGFELFSRADPQHFDSHLPPLISPTMNTQTHPGQHQMEEKMMGTRSYNVHVVLGCLLPSHVLSFEERGRSLSEQGSMGPPPHTALRCLSPSSCPGNLKWALASFKQSCSGNR